MSAGSPEPIIAGSPTSALPPGATLGSDSSREGSPGYSEADETGAGGRGPRANLYTPSASNECEADNCLGPGFGAVMSTVFPALLPKAPVPVSGLSLDEINMANALKGTAPAPGDLLVTVQHFTSVENAAAIESSGGLAPGSWVALPGDVAGQSAAEVEAMLEIGAGRGAMNAQFQTPYSNLFTPANGPFTSGGALQFRIMTPVPVAPGTFVLTAP